MHIGILQFELLIRGATSIKDKRRVVRSVKDHLHREHLVSVAEVAYLDKMGVAGMGLSMVNRNAGYIKEVLDIIIGKLRKLSDAELGSHHVEILSGEQLPAAFTGEDGQPLWTEADKREQAARAEGAS